MLPNAAMKPEQSPVVCFAPPLTDDAIEKYRSLAAAAPPAARDAMLDCLSVVETWWNLPESTRTDGKEMLVSHRSAANQDRTTHKMKLVPLEEEHRQKLDDLIPWRHQIDAVRNLFNELQQDRVNENAKRTDEWRKSLKSAVMASVFTKEERDHLASPSRAILRDTLAAMKAAGTLNDANCEKVISAICPGQSTATFHDQAERRKKADQTIAAMENGTIAPIVPKPDLLDVSLRDAAMHLIWFVEELDKGREPPTLDRIKK